MNYPSVPPPTGHAAQQDDCGQAPRSCTDTQTRDQIVDHIGQHSPVTARVLAQMLNITPAAVRRHLDALEEDGDIESRPVVTAGSRGRGRPAKAFVLTARGQSRLTSTYDALAVSALRFLREQHGDQAVLDFAQQRALDIESRHAEHIRGAGDSIEERAAALAAVLNTEGFAASTTPVHVGMPAVQLCQGHCPVQTVAREFPELCDAESEVFSRILGVPVRRLATLAGGGHVCTTHIPLTTVDSRSSATGVAQQSAPTPIRSQGRSRCDEY